MSEEIYFRGDEILIIDEHGITPYKILRVVKREFKLLTKYYYELLSSNREIKWISSLDFKNKTVVRITPENTITPKPPEKKVIKIEDLDLNKLDSAIKNKLVEKRHAEAIKDELVDDYNNPSSNYVPETPKTPLFGANSVASKDCAIVTTIEPKPESLTGDMVCNNAWYYNEYSLWFIETRIGNYIRVLFPNNAKEMILIKTPATLKDMDLISPKRVNHSYYPTRVKDIFGDNFTVIG
jgi:hypothetical protein